MNSEDFLLESFNLFYNSGVNYKEQGNNVLAKKYLLKASSIMLQIAKKNTGELQIARVERAKRIAMIANNLPQENGIVAPKKQMESSNNANNTPQNNNKPNNQKQSEDSTETMWQASDIPNISFDDVAGLQEVKDSINMRIILPLQYPEIYKAYDKKVGGGILLYGLPGTGKTMIAKAIAHEVQAKFFSVKCSDIVSKWFGEAEKNIKNLFETARKEEKAIIFFDEFEAIASRRGGGENNSVMNRLVPELLAQIQGFDSHSKNNLLLLAATNRPWDIDSAMLRPERFSELIYIDLPDNEARKFMITKALKNVPVDDAVSIDEIVKITEGFNGADVIEFCERLKDNPIRKSIQEKGQTIFKITTEDVEYAQNKVKSSVQDRDKIELQQFRTQFDN